MHHRAGDGDRPRIPFRKQVPTSHPQSVTRQTLTRIRVLRVREGLDESRAAERPIIEKTHPLGEHPLFRPDIGPRPFARRAWSSWPVAPSSMATFVIWMCAALVPFPEEKANTTLENSHGPPHGPDPRVPASNATAHDLSVKPPDSSCVQPSAPRCAEARATETGRPDGAVTPASWVACTPGSCAPAQAIGVRKTRK